MAGIALKRSVPPHTIVSIMVPQEVLSKNVSRKTGFCIKNLKKDCHVLFLLCLCYVKNRLLCLDFVF